MYKGKKTCAILKEIRRRIAEANDIDLIISECRYKGDCAGTCPRCEAEVRYLEEQLARRRGEGRRIMLAGLSAGLLALTGCGNRQAAAPSDTVEIEDTTVGEIELCDSIATAAVEEPDTVVAKEAEKPEIVEPDENVLTGDSVTEVVVESFDDSDPDTVYELTQKNASYPGGDMACSEYIRSHANFDNVKFTTGKKMRVVAQVVVKADGTLGELKVVRSSGNEDFDREVVKAIKSIPKMIPGQISNRDVNSWFTISFRYTPSVVAE